MLENGSDLHINESQKIRHYRIRSIKEIARYVCKWAIIAMSYTHLIRIINNNSNRPPACTSFSYGTGNKVSRNDGLIFGGDSTSHASTAYKNIAHKRLRCFYFGDSDLERLIAKSN